MRQALQLGAAQVLAGLPGRGRRPAMTAAARAWVVSLACQKPKDLGYAQELWTTRLLAQHIRKQSMAAGHPSLSRLGRGTVSEILRANQVQPHRIQYAAPNCRALFTHRSTRGRLVPSLLAISETVSFA
jgi:hypothetical protein